MGKRAASTTSSFIKPGAKRTKAMVATTSLVAAGLAAPFLGAPAWATDCTITLTGVDATDAEAIQSQIDDETCDVVIIEAGSTDGVLDLTGISELVIEAPFSDARFGTGFTLKSTNGVTLTRSDSVFVDGYSASSTFLDAEALVRVDSGGSSDEAADTDITIQGLSFTDAPGGGIDARGFYGTLIVIDSHFENLDSRVDDFGYAAFTYTTETTNYGYLLFRGETGFIAFNTEIGIIPEEAVPSFLEDPSVEVFTNDELYNGGSPQLVVDAFEDVGIPAFYLPGLFDPIDSTTNGAISAGDDIRIIDSTFSNNSGLIEGEYGLEYDGAYFDSIDAAELDVADLFGDGNSISNGRVGAVYSVDDIFSSGSIFTGNAGEDGGAVWAEDDLTIVGSGFKDNEASDEGGATWAGGQTEIHTSTFIGNASGYGGAVYSDSDSEFFIYNSSFVANSATWDGGAVSAKADGEIVNSTFLNNTADYGSSLFLWDSVDEGLSVLGNIFADSSSDAQQVSGRFEYLDIEDFGGNLSTGADESWMGELSLDAVSYASLAFDSSALSLVPTDGTPNPVARIGSSSVAADYVPELNSEDQPFLYDIWNDFDGIVLPEGFGVSDYLLVSDYPYSEGYADQFGTVRTARFDAGAFEVGTRTTVGSGRQAATPSVLEVSPSKVSVTKETVTIFGVNLNLIRSIVIDGKVIKIKSQSNNRITFLAPAGLAGLYDLTLVTASTGNIVVKDALEFGSGLKSGARALVPGFASNSSALSPAMKKEIRAFLKQNPSMSTATCKGFTSAPATRQDAKLARERGKATCEYIKSIRPEMTVKVQKGDHTDKPGQSVRRVRISLS